MKRLGDEYRDYTISDYTCKQEHVFDAICDFVSRHEIGDETVTSLIDEYNDIKECDSMDLDDKEVELQDIYDELWDALDDIAPEGCTFSAHADDPAMVGFWSGEYDE